MRYLRLVINLWIILPISAEVRALFDELQRSIGEMAKYAVVISKDEKNQEATTTVDYRNVTAKEKNHMNIVADLALALPVETDVQKLFESTRLLMRDFVKYVEPADPIGPPAEIGGIRIMMKYDYHICKHRPPSHRFDVRQSEPCDPEAKYETIR